jgi:hypothetical protein
MSAAHLLWYRSTKHLSGPPVALGYPDERHPERFPKPISRGRTRNAGGTALAYIDLFEAGSPQPRCPPLESAWLLILRPAGDVALANVLLRSGYFRLQIDGRAAPVGLLLRSGIPCSGWITREAVGNARRGIRKGKRAPSFWFATWLLLGSEAWPTCLNPGGCHA